MINKRTAYNKAIDTIVDAMATCHDNEADEFIYFHDNMPPSKIATAENLVGAKRDELVAITQYRYNMRHMFNTNEFNKNPKADVFRYTHISEIMKPENILSQVIDMDINKDNEINSRLVISTKDKKSDSIVLFENNEYDMFAWLIGDIDNIIGYSINNYDYRSVSDMIRCIDSNMRRPNFERANYFVEISISTEYAFHKNDKTVKNLKVVSYLRVTYDAASDTINIKSSANIFISALFHGLGFNKNITHEVSNIIKIDGFKSVKTEDRYNIRNRTITCTINTSYSDMNSDTSTLLSSQSQNAFSVIDDKSYHMDGAMLIAKEIAKNKSIFKTNCVVLDPNCDAENFSNIMKAIKEVGIFDWNVFYIVPVKFSPLKLADEEDRREDFESIINAAVQNIRYEVEETNRYTDMTNRINPAHVIVIEEEVYDDLF